ncbi:MAG: PLDc_N domain-containing protein [Thermomicrobiales bacterium]|nr:PLDc_N domain-containing protein [Thermomicrobiales bacterium]
MGLLALIVVQVVIQIFSLIDLARRPAGAVKGNKWLWAAVILAGNLTGAIVYLAVARRPQMVAIDPGAGGDEPDQDRVRRAADLLYGPDNRR